MVSVTQESTLRGAVAIGAAPMPQMLNEESRQRHKYSLRSQASRYADVSSTASSRSFERSNDLDEPPRFVIDLSLPPEQRYFEVCAAFKQQMEGLTPLFDEIVGDFLHWLPTKQVHQLARLFLRSVYDKEENRELQGISQATGVGMHLLVSFNVLLDLLMGCSSGGAAVRDEQGGTKMVHFRTLDWGMPSLRKIVVQLDFKAQQDGPTIASSITYAGYVGVLTGVRREFSVSLNFKPNRRDNGKALSNAKYYYHLLMVLLGRRRSISSQLRCFLLPAKQLNNPDEGDPNMSKYWAYSDAIACIGGLASNPLTTTACYLCFSNGTETTVIEKDRASSVIRSSDNFIVITNNDLDSDPEVESNTAEQGSEWSISLADVISEGKDRAECAERNHHIMRQRAAAAREKAGLGLDLKQALSANDIMTMLLWYPTTNEMTHFACLLDPCEGVVRFCRRMKRPVGKRWIREHHGFHRSKFT